VFAKNNHHIQAVAYSLTAKHRSGFSAFFHQLRVKIFGDDNRKKIKEEQSQNLANSINQIILENETSIFGMKNPSIVVMSQSDVTLKLEKQENKPYELICYKHGFFQEKKILLSFENQADKNYQKLKTSTKEFLENHLSLFNSYKKSYKTEPRSFSSTQGTSIQRQSHPRQNTPDKKEADLTLLIGGSSQTKEHLTAFFGAQQPNDENVLVFAGPSYSGFNIKNQVDGIMQCINRELRSVTADTVIHIQAHSRGCFEALEVCSRAAKDFPEVKFKLFLSDPVKAFTTLNPILQNNNIIPKNVESCVLDYKGLPFGPFDKAILVLEDPTETTLEVRVDQASSHNYPSALTPTLADLKRKAPAQAGVTKYQFAPQDPSTWKPNQSLINSLSGDEVKIVEKQAIPETPNTSRYDFVCGDFLKGVISSTGKWSGYGKRTYPDGGTYKGDFLNGLRHGKGTMTDQKGNIYEGNFVHGKMHGLIEIKSNSGALLFNGTYVHGVMRKGNQYYSHDQKDNRDSYTGDFKNRKPHGHGTLKYKDGSIYTGNFSNGLPNGVGRMEYNDPKGPRSYRGYFKDGRAHGNGCVNSADGRCYDGSFENGLPHGIGIMKFPNGYRYIGNFVNGFIEGKGLMIRPDGINWEGEFRKNQPIGEGIVRNIDDPIGKRALNSNSNSD
jgi:hypothetical protein